MTCFRKRPSLRATVIFPTYGDAPLARWPLESVLKQTVQEIEIFIICDGSPPDMVAFFKNFAKKDPRIIVFEFPKSPRTGETYRDQLIRTKAKGKNIFYCCHDDLWFPDHLAQLEIPLKKHPFVNSLHAAVNETSTGSNEILSIDIIDSDIGTSAIRKRMVDEALLTNFFGLTFGSHTRKAYFRLTEGWATTPVGIWTDLYMWRKFLVHFGDACSTWKEITAFHFPAYNRTQLTPNGRSEELSFFFRKIQDGNFVAKIRKVVSNQFNCFAMKQDPRLNDERKGKPNKINDDSFNEAGYLKANPDVAEAVITGEFQSGLDHYIKHGCCDGRTIHFNFVE